MINNSFIQKVKSATNLLQLVQEYSNEPLTQSGNVYLGYCPHPDHDDSNPSFRVWHNEDGSWSWACMGCHCGGKDKSSKNYGSDAIAFVQWMSDNKKSTKVLSFYEAIKVLANRVGLEVEQDKYSELYEEQRMFAECFHGNISYGMKYLLSRGLDKADIDKWMIGFMTFQEQGKIIHRITFPLLDRFNRVVGFSNRKMPYITDESIAKYKNSANSEIFKKSSYLYGVNHLDKNFDEIRITEGPMDVITSAKYGLKNIVGTLGTAFTKEHADFVQQLNKIPVLCLDSDHAGQKAIRRASKLLVEKGIYPKVFIIPNGIKDMADLALELKDDLEDYVSNHSKPYWQFFVDDYIEIYNAKLNELRLNLMPKIREASKGAYRDDDQIIMKNYIKERTGIEL